ncbi:MAG TPA: outer membrane protein assembly factor BamA [Hyphomicrobiaceae bacterium]|nr:outer membrane protein assembly factor BamA [Hyphomicrobiaceae bacterium]
MPQLRFKVLAGLRALALLVLVFAGMSYSAAVTLPSEVRAQAGGIREIRVVGNRRVEPETVRSYLQFTVGDPYDPAKVDASLRALFGTGLFADVRIDREAGTVIITVVENPVVNQVAFEGNSEVDKETLQNEVQLKPRAIYTRARALADVQRILDVYRRQGRYAASVEPKLIELEQNRVNVVFEINEGKATKVKAINFIGNRAFSDSQLRDIISTTPSGWFDFLKGTNVYDPDRLNLDRELLRQYYIKNGYADARVVSANAELDRDGSGFFITFTIDEGELYTFGDVRIESSLPEIRAESLQGEVLTKPGAYYNGADIDKTAERLTLEVAEMGFAFARVRPHIDRDPVARQIRLTYIIDEGPRIYIERINISGNVRTKDFVIRREFRLAEGDAFNPLLVDKAKKRLQAMGFFKKVEVKRRPGSAPDRVVLDVELEEQPTGELSFGAGYSTVEGVIGDVSFTERNLFGNGQFLRLKLGASTERFQIDLSFTEPRFLDRNLSAGFDLFHKDVNMLSTSSYKSRKTGGGVRLGMPLSENLWLNTSYTLSHDDIYEVDEDEASLAVLQAQGAYLTSAIGTALTYDTRNHPRNPTRGLYLQASTEFAGVGGDAQYVRVQGEGRAYYPITDNIVFVSRIVGGHVEGWGDDGVRLLDLFYKGGETIRGFGRAGIGPRDLDTGDALGGKTYWAATAEVRFPLPLIPDELGMSGAVFADAASLFNAGDTVTSLPQSCPGTKGTSICLGDDATIRSSAGVSLIWNSPVGPLRFDYAFPITKESYDKIQEFRFGASTKF